MRWNKHETPKWGRISNRLDWQHIPHYFFFLVSYKTYKSYFLNWISSLSLICLFFFFFFFFSWTPSRNIAIPHVRFKLNEGKLRACSWLQAKEFWFAQGGDFPSRLMIKQSLLRQHITRCDHHHKKKKKSGLANNKVIHWQSRHLVFGKNSQRRSTTVTRFEN